MLIHKYPFNICSGVGTVTSANAYISNGTIYITLNGYWNYYGVEKGYLWNYKIGATGGSSYYQSKLCKLPYGGEGATFSHTFAIGTAEAGYSYIIDL